MSGSCLILISMLTALVVILQRVDSLCELSFTRRNKVFDFNLVSPLPNYPHGALSEDGFYRVEANGTVLWFQLCDALIFNHDPPRCVGCADCGGPSHCGTACSALVSEHVRGYDVCNAIGHVSKTRVDVIDKENPGKGIIVKMSSGSGEKNCSVSVSVICQTNKVDGPIKLEKSGACHYATELRHPSGCASAVSGHGGGWGWFGTLLIIILCLFGAYFLAGAVYRYSALGVRGIDVIPNLDFWTTVPRGIQSLFASVVQRIRGPSYGHRSSYSPVNF
ncbi:PREDICTED: uncharacterized protein LOC104810122 [Tarenaya hassleriana]|uniref:uncharacterized protein LOC104810122 n=1 Tax=Tarenaya hassleriana TaxID=28532 RepID=UPI00053C8CFD|nr:PREDICTED: uncharacterized protein LOC104810122 [Tarenaya hassleriana]